MGLILDSLGFSLADGLGIRLLDAKGAAIYGPIVDGYFGNLLDDYGAALVESDQPPNAVYDARTALFFCAEIETFNPATGAYDVLRVSDIGYRTRATDPGGVVVYPGVLDTAFEIDRKVSLDPTQPSSRSDGNIRLVNLGQRFDAFTLPRNNDSRAVRLLVGQKRYDTTRGVFVDPAYSDLRPFFAGTTGSWLVAEDELTIPIKDTSYWLSRPAQTRTYGGAGGLDGGEALAGKRVPMTRGGTADFPVLNVPLLQVDTVQQIWQWTDGPGTVVSLYENGAAVFAYAGDVTDLYVGTTPPGSYRTCNALGVLQLGSNPVGQITADVTGGFPVAGAVSTAPALAYHMLTETLGLPMQYVSAFAFDAFDAAYPYVAGTFVDDGSAGLAVVLGFMTSFGARLSSSRSGLLRPFTIQASLADATIERVLTTGNVVSVTPVALPATLDPPPYRWQVSYGHNHTLQTSGLSGALADQPARKQFLAAADRYANWTDGRVQSVWLRPNDPAPVQTLLLNAADARKVANAAGATWYARPGYYDVAVPVDVAAGLDINSVLHLTWPLPDLAGGALAQVVGEQIRSYDGVVTLQVLVANPVPYVPQAGHGIGQFAIGVDAIGVA